MRPDETETCSWGQRFVHEFMMWGNAPDVMTSQTTSSTDLRCPLMQTYTIFFPRLIRGHFLVRLFHAISQWLWDLSMIGLSLSVMITHFRHFDWGLMNMYVCMISVMRQSTIESLHADHMWWTTCSHALPAERSFGPFSCGHCSVYFSIHSCECLRIVRIGVCVHAILA